MKKMIVSLLFVIFLLNPAVFAQDFPVRETLESYVKSGDLPGMVTIIATQDKILQVDTLGFSNIEKQTPMSESTVFWIASQSKPVTAVAVMILVDEGKLFLTEPVTTYLPELGELRVIAEQDDEHTLLVPLERPITLEHLLSHTSGMVWAPPLQLKFGIDVLPLSKSLMTCAMTPLQSQPGTKYSYSNMGINMAATVVERVSGMPFEAFLEKRIFEPLGMKETTFYPTAEQLERQALVYRFDKEQGKLVATPNRELTYPLDDKKIRFPEAAGGLFSTPRELVRFYQMLQGNGVYDGKRILSEEAVREIRKRHPDGLEINYGLGVVTNGKVFGHGGACGTDSMVNTNNGRVILYFIQEEGLAKAGEAREAFFRIANQ